jgi:Mg/Co/Ni transporter MgtE
MQRASASRKTTVGWNEGVALPKWRVVALRAKVDTDARTHALHVDNVVPLPGRRVRFVNGVGIAPTTSAAVFLWSRSPVLAAVVGISMVLSMTCAGLAGRPVPLMLVAMRQEPAQSSSILLTTVTDVVGIFSFVGIATLLCNAF